ncbi:MAG TPA: UvrD-helicase domain-containing protein [Candidatus Kapabacteria bacterium]|nr:UvrD-helicase domain-containing protein [Candidatus Kapabacteria bacterium]
MPLTPAQKEAIEAESHCILIANAGSGKTFTVVQRYIYIIEHNPDISAANIAAITFTENAANELKEKITEGLYERLKELNDLPETTDRANRIWKALQEIDSSYISTIHGFCSRLLRAYPIEAGIDPSFVILQGIERSLLIDECINSALIRELKRVYEQPDSDSTGLRKTFNYYGRQALRNKIRTLFKNSFRTKQALNEVWSKSDTALFGEASEVYEQHVNNILQQDQVRSAFDDLLKLSVDSNHASDAKEYYTEFISSKTFGGIVYSLTRLLDSVLTKSDEPRSTIFKKGKISAVDSARQIIVGALSEMVELRHSLEMYMRWQSQPQPSLNHIRNIFYLYERASEEYFNEKLSQGFLEHDDLIELGIKLLQTPTVQKDISAQLQHCFIDEYQDTDERQYNILTSITQHFSNNVIATLVGDPKQSIYRFRDADLSVFHKTIDECSAASQQALRRELDTCFRMLPFPLTLANKVTDHLFGSAENKQIYYYSPLIGNRNEKDGSVSILCADSAEGEDIESEESLIAKTIYALTVGENAKSYNDCAILIRSRKHLPMLELTLRKYQIPFAMTGGLGFYQQQEVIDAMTILNFLINPDDDLAFVALLRSPYIGINDILLWNFTHHKDLSGKNQSLWKYLNEQTNQLPEDIKTRLAVFTELLPLVGRLSSRLILERVVERTQIELLYYSFIDGEQKVSNLRKFVSLSSVNNLSIWDFMEQCAILQEQDDPEQQAVQPTENAVHIMTIHASKGLQFPVVFLPYLNDPRNKRSSDTTSFLSRQKPYFHLENESNDGIINHPLSSIQNIQNDRESFEEEKRVLYVALTRSRDDLYLGCRLDKNNNIASESPMDMIIDGLGITVADILAGNPIQIERKLEMFTEVGFKEEICHQSIPIIRSVEIFDRKSPAAKQSERTSEHLDLHSYQPSQGITRYSPTQLLAYQECPTKYYLRYKLGLPEEYFSDTEFEPADRFEFVQPTIYGQLLHKTFEDIETLASDNSVNEEYLRSLFTRLSIEYHIDESRSNKYYARLKKETVDFIESALFKLLSGSSRSYTELPLRYSLDSHFVVSGVIDRLFIDQDGIWNILDYKTSEHADVDDIKRYTFQTKVYAFLISKLFDVTKIVTHLYFTASARTVSTFYSDTDFAAFGGELKRVITLITNDTRTSSIESIFKNRNHCKDCNYSTDNISTCILDKKLVTIS